MITTLFFTGLLLLVGWYFYDRNQKKKGGYRKNEASQSSTNSKKKKGGQQPGQDKAQSSTDQPDENQTADAKAAAAQNLSKRHRNKVEHAWFFKSFKKNESNILDFDLSLDNHYLVIASKDRTHVVYDIKADSVAKFTTNTIPERITISEKGKYLALSLETKVSVFKNEGGTITPMKTFEVCKDKLLGLCISEESEVILAAGSNQHCNFHVLDLKGSHLKTLQSGIGDAYSVLFDKKHRRGVYFSSSSEIKIFGEQHNVKNEYKDFLKEHALFGHKAPVIDGSFNNTGSRFYSVSKDRTLREWDLSPQGFQDTHIKCLHTWTLPEAFTENDIRIQWIGSSGDEQHLCLSVSSSLYFFKSNGDELVQVDIIEDAHVGETIDKLLYTYDHRAPEKKGIVFSKSEKKLFSWKPKYT